MKSTTLFPELNLPFTPNDPVLAGILENACRLLESHPEIVSRIEADLNRRALELREERRLEKAWKDAKKPGLPAMGLPEAGNALDVARLSDAEVAALLGDGRPRMTARACYLFMVMRGAFGGFEDQGAWGRMSDSTTFCQFLFRLGVQRFPGQSTVRTNVNAISLQTRGFIFQCQLSTILGMRLDTLDTLFVDSTHVEANSAWPTDSGLILKLLERTFALGRRLDTFGIPNFRAFACPFWLEKLKRLNFKICHARKKAERRKLHREFIVYARKLADRLQLEHDRLGGQWEKREASPRTAKQVSLVQQLIKEGIKDSLVIADVAFRRVVEEKDFKRSEDEKIYSVSDRTAAFITKGNRPSVFGYRPQLGRSANGFITTLLVPVGNASDSSMLVETVKSHAANSGILPVSVSTDDGYPSRSNRQTLLDMGVENISFNGAKGKKITPEEEWECFDYQELRRNRSSAESLMSTIKSRFGFEQLSRCGIEAVREELLEKAIAHNFWRISREAGKSQDSPPVAA